MERALRLPSWLFARCGECHAPRGTHNTGCPHAPRTTVDPVARAEALTAAVEAVAAAEAALTAARGPWDLTARRLRRELPRLEQEIAVEASLARVDHEAF